MKHGIIQKWHYLILLIGSHVFSTRLCNYQGTQTQHLVMRAKRMIITVWDIECREYAELLEPHGGTRVRISLVKESYTEEVSSELGLNVYSCPGLVLG